MNTSDLTYLNEVPKESSKDRLYHRHILMVVVLLAPCSFRCMAPFDLRGFEILHVEDLMNVQVVGLMVP